MRLAATHEDRQGTLTDDRRLESMGRAGTPLPDLQDNAWNQFISSSE